MKVPVVFVKYCGGCNPKFDRRIIVKELERYFGFRIEPFNDKVLPDITIIVKGCKSECLILDAYKSKMKTILIDDTENLEVIIEEIKDLLE